MDAVARQQTALCGPWAEAPLLHVNGGKHSHKETIMKSISRRDILAVTAAGGLATVPNAAFAQTGEPQPRRGADGGNDPGPRNLMREEQNPDLLVPPSTD